MPGKRFTVVGLSLVSWLTFAATGAPSTNTFVRVPTYNIPGYPATAAKSVVLADFNGDGVLDVALTDDSRVDVYLGQGDGTFSPPVSYPAGVSPVSLAVADFNRDGNLDLVVANGDAPSTISVLLGKGDGTFGPPTSFQTGGTTPNWVAVGDFNNDGLADVAVANELSNNVSIFLGKGDGTFQTPKVFAVPNGAFFVAVGDFNNDHVPDLAVGGGGTTPVSILLGNGDGTFQAARSVGTGAGGAVAVGDFNHDGKLDLAFTSPALDFGVGNVSVLLGNGDGTFQPQTNYPVGVQPGFVIVSDLNHDGVPDLAVANQSDTTAVGTVSVLLGKGDGTFSPAAGYDTKGSPLALAAGDLKNVGKTDLVASTSYNFNILFANGDGTFQAPPNLGPSSPVSAGVVADFNADGKPDLVGLGQGGVVVQLGNGDGTFQPPVSYSSGGYSNSLAVGDFNGDGKLDLIVTNDGGENGTGSVAILLGNGDGTFQPAVTYSLGAEAFPTAVAVGDFNHDNKLDLAVAEIPTVGVILLGNGDGTFQGPANFPSGLSGNQLLVADLNNDGNLDLVVADSQSGNITVLLGNPDGTFQPPASYSSGGGGVGGIALGDFNHDGIADLAANVGGYGSGAVAVLLGKGDGTFPAVFTYNPGVTGSGGIAVGDFNGDGILDLVAAGNTINADNLGVLLGNGDGTFQAGVTYFAGAGGGALTAADLNGDGAADLVVTDVLGASVLLNIDPGAMGVPTVNATPSSLAFGNQPVNTTSSLKTVTLTNTSKATLSLSTVNTTGDFRQSNICGGALAPGTSCPITVDFAPATEGPLTGQLSVADNASGNPQVVSLSGTGTGPVVQLSPSSLTFPNTAVGTTSAAMLVTLTNTGSANLMINGITTTAPFNETSNCPSTLAPSGNCSISVTFSPVVAGLQTDVLSVSDNVSNIPQTVKLSGTGVVGAVATLSPANLAFGNQLVGSASGPQTVTLSNTGSQSLVISGIAATGDFFVQPIATKCATNTSLAPGSSCRIAVGFRPTAVGSRSGSLVVNDNAAGSPQTVPLSGNGQDLSIAPATGSGTSVSVSPGQTATYMLTATPLGGLTGSVSFSCSGAPARATCSVSPASLALSGTSPGSIAVSVATTAPSVVEPRLRFPAPPAHNLRWWLVLLGLTLGFGLASRKVRTPIARVARSGALLALVSLALLLGHIACGGGGMASGGGGGNPGTPAGTYSLTVLGQTTAGQRSINLSLTVQ